MKLQIDKRQAIYKGFYLWNWKQVRKKKWIFIIFLPGPNSESVKSLGSAFSCSRAIKLSYRLDDDTVEYYVTSRKSFEYKWRCFRKLRGNHKAFSGDENYGKLIGVSPGRGKLFLQVPKLGFSYNWAEGHIQEVCGVVDS